MSRWVRISLCRNNELGDLLVVVRMCGSSVTSQEVAKSID